MLSGKHLSDGGASSRSHFWLLIMFSMCVCFYCCYLFKLWFLIPNSITGGEGVCIIGPLGFTALLHNDCICFYNFLISTFNWKSKLQSWQRCNFFGIPSFWFISSWQVVSKVILFWGSTKKKKKTVEDSKFPMLSYFTNYIFSAHLSFAVFCSKPPHHVLQPLLQKAHKHCSKQEQKCTPNMQNTNTE